MYTDDPNHSNIDLTLTGDVIAPADIVPMAARLIGTASSPIRAEITITPPTANPFEIIGAKAEDGKNIVVHLEKKSDPEALYFIVHISNLKKEPGRYTDKIILTTTSNISPELVVRVFGIIREN